MRGGPGRGVSLGVVLALALPAGALAQGPTGFRLDRYTSPSAPDDLLWVERAAILGDAAPFARLVFSYSDDPLVTRENGDEVVAIVEDQLGIHVSLGLSMIDRVHLAVTMPLYLQST